LRNEATQLLAKAFPEAASAGRVAGWKDPRNSLTLPFWRALAPDLRVIVCLRGPLATARSVAARGGHSLQFGLRLWEAYYRSLAEVVDEVPHIVTHYDAFRVAPERELERLADFLGIALAPGAATQCVAPVRRAGAYELADEVSMLKAVPSLSLRALYDGFRRRAGPVYANLPEHLANPEPAALDFQHTDPDEEALAARRESVSLRMELARQASHAEEMERWTAAQFHAKQEALKRSAMPAEGFTIDFTLAGNSARHTLHGWSVAEANGTWTDGHGAAVLLPPLGFVPSQVELTIHATPFLAGKIAAQKASLRVRGQIVGTWTVEAFEKLRVRIEPSLLEGLDNTVLELLLPHATTPLELGLSVDRRRLGLLVSSISLSFRA